MQPDKYMPELNDSAYNKIKQQVDRKPLDKHDEG